MRIEFPLVMVLTPGPQSEIVDILWTANDMEGLAARLAWLKEDDFLRRYGPLFEVTLYTDAAEARADAEARIQARDAALSAKDAERVPLRSLNPGEQFEWNDGGRYLVTSLPDASGERAVVGLASGRVWMMPLDERVRRVAS